MSRAAANRTAFRWYSKEVISVTQAEKREQLSSISEAVFWEKQKRLFLQVYAHARTNVPFYSSQPEAYPPAHYLRAGGHLLDMLSALPVIDKAVVRENHSMFISSSLNRSTTWHTTSGTTGSPLRIPATLRERSISHRIQQEWMRRESGKRWPSFLWLSGLLTPEDGARPISTDLTGKHSFGSIYSLHGSKSATVFRQLFEGRRAPDIVYGYASALHLLADLFDRYGTPAHRASLAISTSEVLSPVWRDGIASSIAPKVRAMYGSQEGCHLAVEVQPDLYAIDPRVGIIEILAPDSSRVGSGDVGEVTVTGLVRRQMPLIRYRLGDSATSTGYAPAPAADVSWPTVGLILGRSEDLVVARDGRRVGYLNFHATKNTEGIAESQLVQTGLGRFTMRIVPKSNSARLVAAEETISHEIQKRLGEDVHIRFDYLAAIPRGPNGKLRSVVVDIEQGS